MTTNTTIKNLPDSAVEITGELAAEQFESYRPQAVKELGKEAVVDGFRKGHVPEKILEQTLGDDRILLQMADLALQDLYPKLVTEHKLDAIGRPEVVITKLAKGNPLGFTVTTAVMPEVKLPDHKKIAKEIMNETEESAEATDEEVEKVIEEIRKGRAPKAENGAEPELPELTDDFVKTLGDFESVDGFRAKIKENLGLEKASRAKEKRRLKIIETIVEQSEIPVPKVMTEAELNKMVLEMKHQIEHMGLDFAEYLKHIKKTEAELRETWQADAEKRVKFGLVMHALAEAEKIEAPAEELEKEVSHILSHHEGVNPERARQYAENLIINEKTFQFLENQK